MKRFNTESVAGKVALKSRLASALLLILSILILTSAASAAELVVNGDSELPVVDTDLGWMTYYGENYPLTEPGDCDKLDSLDPQPANCNDDKRVPGWSVFWTRFRVYQVIL